MIYAVEIEFTENMLGGASLNPNIYAKYIATRKGESSDSDHTPLTDEETREELASLPEDERGMTGFHRDAEGNIFVYDYCWKGFFKESCGFLRNIASTESKGLTNYKKRIDGLLFVYPRRIPLILNGAVTHNVRPLRAQTMQGERITIACSEQVTAGTRARFEVSSIADSILTQELLTEWLDYGALKGFGQWRNASWGRFTYTMQPVEQPQFTPKLALLLA